jgi:ribosomal protein S12 methylthiotransferase
MPLQHASDSQLRLMRRGRDKKFIQGLLTKLRDRIPNLVMRSSFIVGFPGETEDDFKELCDFVQEQRFQHVGAFEFSKEEGTPSFDLPNQLTARVKASRRKALMKIQRAISREYQQSYVGKTLEVLVEGPHPETPLLLQGRHAGQAPEIDGSVVINSGEAKPGDLVLVKIDQAGDYDLVGGIIGVSKPSARSMAPRYQPPTQGMPVSRKLLNVLPTRQ